MPVTFTQPATHTFRVGERVRITNNAISWLPPQHACFAFVTKLTKGFIYTRNEHGSNDKWHHDGRPVGGGDYFLSLKAV